jgi:hypothetical protein
MIAATSFGLDMGMILKSDYYIEPEITDLLYVYHRSVEKKLQVYQTEMKGGDDTNSSVKVHHELLINMILKNLERSALIVTPSSPMLTLLHDKATDNKSHLTYGG